ncbi:MAG: Fe-S-containing protein [Terriglobia bacterium]
MFSAFLISLREGVEAALVVGICLAYLRKIGRLDLERPVWYAVGAALGASVAAAALLEQFAWNQETVEGFFMLLAALLLVTMIIWMRRVARSLRGQIEGRVGRLAGRVRFAALGLFLFVFFMVLREGIETVLFLGAVSLNTEGILLLFGTLLGLALAVALGLFFFKGALPIRLDRFFEATSIMLIILAGQLTLTGIHELAEALVLPSGPGMMRLLGPIVRNDIFFFLILLLTAAWLLARELLRRRHAAPLPAALNEAEQRRRRWERQRERRWMAAAAATAFTILMALTADYVYARSSAALSPAVPVETASAVIRIPVAEVNDGNLHRFSFTHNRTTVRFIVIRGRNGQLQATLDACQICGPKGYYQDGRNVVCKNCAAVIYIPSIGLPGGCNPIPLAARVDGGQLLISVAEFVSGQNIFEPD